MCEGEGGEGVLEGKQRKGAGEKKRGERKDGHFRRRHYLPLTHSALPVCNGR